MADHADISKNHAGTTVVNLAEVRRSKLVLHPNPSTENLEEVMAGVRQAREDKIKKDREKANAQVLTNYKLTRGPNNPGPGGSGPA